MLVKGLLIFSISSLLSFGKLYFSKNLSISSSCPFYWHIVADSSLMILCIFVLFVVISPFSFLILLIWFFSLFFLLNLANSLSILFIFSENQLLALLIFAMLFTYSFPISKLFAVTQPWFEFPVSYSKFPLAIYFTHVSVYVSMQLFKFSENYSLHRPQLAAYVPGI